MLFAVLLSILMVLFYGKAWWRLNKYQENSSEAPVWAIVTYAITFFGTLISFGYLGLQILLYAAQKFPI